MRADVKTYYAIFSARIICYSLYSRNSNPVVCSSDSVGCSASNGLFDTAAAGTGKTVTADEIGRATCREREQIVRVAASSTANIDKRNEAASIRADGNK